METAQPDFLMKTETTTKKAAAKKAGGGQWGAMAKAMMSKGKAKGKAKAKAGEAPVAKVGALVYHPLLETVPTMSSVVEELRKLVKTARGSTLMDAKARLAEREPEWAAFVRDVKARGVVEPVTVMPKPGGGWWVVDGRNRTCAAIEAELPTVPIRVTKEAPQVVILGSLAARRHVSKELLAFVALDCYPALIGEGKKGRPENRNDCGLTDENRNDCGFSTLAELAESVGVSLRTMETAARVQRMFRASAKARKKWEWRLYAGTSFQGILAGDAVDKTPGNGGATDGASVAVRKYFQSFAGRVSKSWEALAKEGAEAVAKVEADAKAALASLPDAAWEWVVEAAADREACLNLPLEE